ncbi:MAG TPA: TonB C-terminal domain-containing protein [Campylobacterales bacterium]|nr:TonB C-terminal domain-containing protein [Campylobacterales bacterium]
MDKNSYFWIGGFSSFGLYALVIAVLVYTLTKSEELRKIAIKSEQSAIEVSMEELEAAALTQTSKKTVEKVVVKPKETPVTEKIVKEKAPTKPVEESISPKKMFEGLIKQEPAKKNETKKQVEPEKPQEQQAEQIPEQKKQSAKDLLAAMAIKKNSEISFTSFNTSGEVNEYLSKIAKIIKQGWTPSKNDIGAVSVLSVNIEPDGSFSFRVKKGASAEFNDRLTAYMKFLQQKGFPPPSDKKPISVEFNFKARE